MHRAVLLLHHRLIVDLSQLLKIFVFTSVFGLAASLAIFVDRIPGLLRYVANFRHRRRTRNARISA